MKKIFLLVTLVVGFLSAFAQNDDSTKYIWYRYTYGTRVPRSQSDSIQTIPRDTAHNAKYGSVAVKNNIFYIKDSTKWKASGAEDNAAAYTGIKITRIDDQNIKFENKGRSFASISEMRSYNQDIDNTYVFKLSDANGVREYKYDASDVTSADDGFTTIVGTTAPNVGKRFKIYYEAAVNARAVFGITPNDGTNDAAGLQAAVNFAGSVLSLTKRVLISNGDYNLSSSTITVPAGVTLEFQSARIIGTGTINGGIIDASYQEQIVATTVTFNAEGTVGGKFSVKWYGAIGNNIADDQPSIQKASDVLVANPGIPRDLYFPKGAYHTTLPIIVYKWDGADYRQCNVNFIGQEAANWNDLSNVARILYTGTDGFAIGLQQVRSMEFKGLSVEGTFNPPNGPTDWVAYYKRPWATWASTYGVRDQPQSPMAGIVIDPFGNSPTQIPADGGYPGLTSWYRGTGGGSGSSGVVIEECRVRGFTVNIGISLNSWTQNAENCIIRNCALTVCKVAVASGQLQTKGNFVYNCISDDRVYTCLSGDYGNGHGTQPYVNGWIIAGDVIQIVHGASSQFPVTFQGIFAESIFRIGDIASGAGETSFIGCNLDFSLFVSPYIIADYHFKGDFVKFKDCTLRFFDDSANHRLYFNGNNISFDNCWFDKPPLGKYDKGISSSLPQFVFNECRTFNNELIGFRTLKGRINNPGYKVVKYGDVDIEDAGTLTLDDVALRSLKAHFKFGGLQRFVGVGNTTVTIDTTAHAGSFSVSAGASKVLAVGDYILYGPSTDSVLGRIQSINYSTGAIIVTDIPIGPKTATYDMTAAYYSIARGYFIGDVTNGSATIANVKFGTVLNQPVVGDRSGIGYPETVITAVGGSSVTLSDNAYYTRTQDYRPIDRSEKFEMISYYDLSHANLDGWTFLIPQNAIWKIWASPYTNVQHTYYFTKGGYAHPTTFGQTLQAEWKLTADNNPDAFYINEDKTVHFPGGYLNMGTGSGASDFGIRNNAGIIEIKNSGDSWAAPAVNPMTTQGDIIYGGASGAPTRLAPGTAGMVLQTNGSGSAPTWVDLGIAKGTYTPTLTAVANVAASTAALCYYYKIGTEVTVYGTVQIDPTAATTLTQLGLSLPIASTFTTSTQAAGTFAFNNGEAGIVISDAANVRAELQFTPTTGTNRTYWFHFSYHVQ